MRGVALRAWRRARRKRGDVAEPAGGRRGAAVDERGRAHLVRQLARVGPEGLERRQADVVACHGLRELRVLDLVGLQQAHEVLNRFVVGLWP